MRRMVKRTQKAEDIGSQDVDKYLAGVPEPARTTLRQVREVIRSCAPRETTEGISYGMPAFRYHGYLVGYAAFAKHCSFFPGSGSLLHKFGDRVKGFAISKGTIRFPQDKPLPATLIRELVKARVQANQRKKKR